MRTIDITQEKVALVDNEDYEFLSQFSWHAMKGGNNLYAIRSIKLPSGRWTERAMHRDILDLPEGMMIDHRDGNGLNNQRCNLRPANHQQNMANRKMHKNNTSGYKGVRLERERWRARINFDGKKISIGSYDDPVEAAVAYDMAAIELFGEFARLNFPAGGQQ